MIGISIRDLTVRLGEKTIIHEITAAIGGGQVLGLIGPNGAGKSTLLKAMAGLLPRQGDILINGLPADGLDRRARARKVGYLGQNGQAHWPVTVEALVALGRLPFKPSGAAATTPANPAIDAAIVECDLSGLRRRPVTTLSGGERARALLARVLAGEPEIILADEPVAGLDPAHQLSVMTTLQRKAAEGAAVIIVLHDLTLAARFCQRVILLHDGKIAADGPPADVLTADNLATCYGIDATQGISDGIPFIIPANRI